MVVDDSNEATAQDDDENSSPAAQVVVSNGGDAAVEKDDDALEKSSPSDYRDEKDANEIEEPKQESSGFTTIDAEAPATTDTNGANNNNNASASEIDAFAAPPSTHAIDTSETNNAQQQNNEQQQTSMALNVAYEALEHVRQANIAVEFGREISVKQCIPCLREGQQQNNTQQNNQQRRFGLRKKVQTQGHFRAAQACLTCGYAVCTQHRCPDFAREHVVICNDCVPFFSLDFVANSAEKSQEERRQLKNHMLDVYDRAFLILKYSSQFTDEIATTLEEGTKSKDKYSLGSSATGFVGGLVGVAGALTIWTPVGVPLLLTSVVFGSAGAATSAGSEAMFHRSSANKAADTIITVHGMLQSLARLSKQYLLEQAAAESYAVADEIGDEPQDATTKSEASFVSTEGKPQQQPQNQAYRNSNRKNGMRAIGTVFRPLTLGVLSAASVVMEAREMKTTVDKIRNGSPCSKASNVKAIAQDMDPFPTTNDLAKECSHYFE